MIAIVQRILLILAAMTLLGVLLDIGASLAATIPASTPARVVHVQAGPYPLRVSLYKSPAIAGFALPFTITAEQAKQDAMQFSVSSLPGKGVDATPIRGLFTTDPGQPGTIHGTAEVTVQGTWLLHITVAGAAGNGKADIPFQAVAPVALSTWSGWPIGSIPVVGLLVFLLVQCRNNYRASLAKRNAAVQ